jgi:hypothetical protein
VEPAQRGNKHRCGEHCQHVLESQQNGLPHRGRVVGHVADHIILSHCSSPRIDWVGLDLLALALLVFFFCAIRFFFLSDDRGDQGVTAPPNKKSPAAIAWRQNKWQTNSWAMSVFIMGSNSCNPMNRILPYITLEF